MDKPSTGGQALFCQLAAPVRGPLVLFGVLLAVSALSGLLPVAAAMALIETLVPAAGGHPRATGEAWLLVAALIVSLFVSQVLRMAGYVVSHFADATLVEDIRQRQITHLLRLPLGWFDAEPTGAISNVTTRGVTLTRHTLQVIAIRDTVSHPAGRHARRGWSSARCVGSGIRRVG
jgi:ATP-binding cassette subfamily B protein IrtA